jgi:hypothetical protein
MLGASSHRYVSFCAYSCIAYGALLHDFHVVGSGLGIHAFMLYFCCHFCCSCIFMPAFIVAWAGGSGRVSPGNIVHTFHDYEREHLLNHSMVCGPPSRLNVNLAIASTWLGAGYGLSTRGH